jgi:hypothetical protein
MGKDTRGVDGDVTIVDRETSRWLLKRGSPLKRAGEEQEIRRGWCGVVTTPEGVA